MGSQTARRVVVGCWLRPRLGHNPLGAKATRRQQHRTLSSLVQCSVSGSQSSETLPLLPALTSQHSHPPHPACGTVILFTCTVHTPGPPHALADAFTRIEPLPSQPTNTRGAEWSGVEQVETAPARLLLTTRRSQPCLALKSVHRPSSSCNGCSLHAVVCVCVCACTCTCTCAVLSRQG